MSSITRLAKDTMINFVSFLKSDEQIILACVNKTLQEVVKEAFDQELINKDFVSLANLEVYATMYYQRIGYRFTLIELFEKCLNATQLFIPESDRMTLTAEDYHRLFTLVSQRPGINSISLTNPRHLTKSAFAKLGQNSRITKLWLSGRFKKWKDSLSLIPNDQLREIQFVDPHISIDKINRLFKNQTELKWITLINSKADGTTLTTIARHCKAPIYFEIRDSKDVIMAKESLLDVIQTHKNSLRNLSFGSYQFIDDVFLDQILELIPDLEALGIADCPNVTEAGLIQFILKSHITFLFINDRDYEKRMNAIRWMVKAIKQKPEEFKRNNIEKLPADFKKCFSRALSSKAADADFDLALAAASGKPVPHELITQALVVTLDQLSFIEVEE